MVENLQLFAAFIGFFAYAMLIHAIYKSNVKQNFAAFMLWGILDLIATITTILKHGNFWLPLSNAIGASAIAVLLVRKQNISWTRVESMTACLVLICLVIWYFSGPTLAIVASSIAVVIASLPQMVETWNKPGNTPRWIYAVFLLANIISFIAGRSWSVEERFYPACAIFLCLVIIGFTLKKRNI